MNIQNYISDFSDVEAYNASTLNCHAFRQGCDVRQSNIYHLGRNWVFKRNERLTYNKIFKTT